MRLFPDGGERVEPGDEAISGREERGWSLGTTLFLEGGERVEPLFSIRIKQQKPVKSWYTVHVYSYDHACIVTNVNAWRQLFRLIVLGQECCWR